MNNVEQISAFLQRVTSDENLTTAHVGVCTALAAAWVSGGFNNSFNISRKNIMKSARIKSKSTYHRIIASLVDYKYIEYHPSFHPKNGSRVSIHTLKIL